MNCPNCNRKLRIATEQVGADANQQPVFHRFAYCDSCMKKKDLDIPQNDHSSNRELCPICNRELRIAPEQVGVDGNNLPIFHRFAYCDFCKRKKDLDLQQKDQSAADKKICPKCGKEVSVAASFCPECGENIVTQEQMPAQTPYVANSIPTRVRSDIKPAKENNTNIIIIGVVAAVVVLGLLGMRSLSGTKDTNVADTSEKMMESVTEATKQESSDVNVDSDTKKTAYDEKSDESSGKGEEPQQMAALTPETIVLDGATISQQQAYRKALSYLEYSSFSHKGLIEQLEFEGFSTEDASWAVDNCGTDWTEQAKLKAKEYMDYNSFSYDGLVEQLEYEGFSHDDAVAGASYVFDGDNSAGSGNSNSITQENALKKAKDYLEFSAFSRQGLIDQLVYESFSKEDATYAADNCGADWNEQAAKKAQNYLEFSSFSKDGLVDQLMYEGFTREQAEYGVKKIGF